MRVSRRHVLAGAAALPFAAAVARPAAGDWATKFRWTRTFVSESRAEVTWDIPANTPVGKFRFVHFGAWKHGLTGAIAQLSGTSRAFVVS